MAGKALPFGTMALGGVFLWSAVNNKAITATIQSLIQGQKPVPGPMQPPAVTAPAGGGAGGGLSGGGGPPPKGSYDHTQLMQLWQQVGGSAAAANNAACHAIQESSGNPGATSPNPDGGTNVGLWQLDTPHGKGAGYTIAQLKDPVLNARVTVHATNDGQDWSAWATPGC